MTEKERYVNTMSFGKFDRIPNMEICLWGQTRERWLAEGMPENTNTAFIEHGEPYFGLEGYESVHIDAIAPYPLMESRTIEETGEYLVFVDGMGRTRRARKSGTVGGTRMSMDTYLDFPVKDMKSFREFRKGYEGPLEERYPKNWPKVREAALKTDRPLTLMNPLNGTFGYYSMLRNWMGTEGLSYLFYDDPALIRECLEFLTDFVLRLLEKAVSEITFDFYYVHEDMSYKNGPLVSPALFKSLFLPQYRRFVGFLKSHGVKIVLVDTDGNHDVLTPLFLEAGVDGFGPIERAADMDPVVIRKKYGKSVCMAGGIDKREIAKGRAAIEREVNKIIVPLIDQGGFIPMIDHSIPPDISLKDFQYYLELKEKAIRKG